MNDPGRRGIFRKQRSISTIKKSINHGSAPIRTVDEILNANQ